MDAIEFDDDVPPGYWPALGAAVRQAPRLPVPDLSRDPPAADDLAGRQAQALSVLAGRPLRQPAACGIGTHWTAGYVGLPYVPLAFDCAHLVERVMREQFGRTICLPAARPHENRSAQLQQMIDAHAPHLAERIDAPAEGHPVLMVGAGRLNHVGLAAAMVGEWWVLHNFIRARQVVLHRVRELPRWGLSVEGYYRWL